MNFNATFFGQLIAFAFFVWFCMKFIWPLLLGMIREREKRIADGLAAADQGQKKLVEADQILRDSVEEGKQKAAEIIGQAQRRGDEMIEEAKQQATAEGQRQLEAAKIEIEQEKERAREELRHRLAMLAVAGSEQILRREVDQNVHNEMLQELSAKL